MAKKKHLRGKKELKEMITKEEFKQMREDLEGLVAYIQDFNSFLPIATCVISPSRDVTDINRAFEELTNYKPLEIIGKSVKIIFLEKEKIEAIIDEVTKKKIIKKKEATLITKDKKIIFVSIAVSVREDKEGNIIGYFLSVTDITEIKKSQELLEEKVKERTRELQLKIEELEKFQKITIGRELKMIELKKEIERLKDRLEVQKRQ